jgi:hypothetical protein
MAYENTIRSISIGRDNYQREDTYQVLNALSSGVSLDSVDCAPAINKAIEEAVALNRVLYLPDGTYYISTPIVLKSNTRLELAPNAVIRTNYSPFPTFTFDSIGVSHVRVKGGKLLDLTGLGNAFEFSDITFASDVHISDMTITGYSNQIISVPFSCQFVTFNNVKFSDSTESLIYGDFRVCPNITFNRCIFSHTGNNAALRLIGRDIILRDCYISTSGVAANQKGLELGLAGFATNTRVGLYGVTIYNYRTNGIHCRNNSGIYGQSIHLVGGSGVLVPIKYDTLDSIPGLVDNLTSEAGSGTIAGNHLVAVGRCPIKFGGIKSPEFNLYTSGTATASVPDSLTKNILVLTSSHNESTQGQFDGYILAHTSSITLVLQSGTNKLFRQIDITPQAAVNSSNSCTVSCIGGTIRNGASLIITANNVTVRLNNTFATNNYS